VRIRGVVADSPAESARLRGSDVILAVDGTAVGSPEELRSRLSGLDPGSGIALTVRRAGRELELSARLSERPPADAPMRLVRGWLGVEAIALPPTLRVHFGAPESAGVLVSDVKAGSPAEAAGIRIGDVIYEAAEVAVTSPGFLARFATEAGIDNPVRIVLARDGVEIVVEPRVVRVPDEGGS
jgi:serine protease Do